MIAASTGLPALALLLVIADSTWITLSFSLWVLLVSTYILYTDFQLSRTQCILQGERQK